MQSEKQNQHNNLEELKQFQPKSSIQNAFKRFQKEKFYQLKLNKYLKQTNVDRSLPEFKINLRKCFVEIAQKYIGVPYAQKYHKPGDKLYSAPLFLDCCAYIRQIVFDLRHDFGFTLGKWNQAYQYDLLPDQNLKQQDLKPGDIIFYSAKYYDKRIKPFPHDMVHVQVYMGEGKSIGSRWQKGTIQIFDSYKFKSNLYYDISYHFKSIDAWLEGRCESHCKQHIWLDDRANQWLSDKFSVFADPTLDDLKILDVEIEGPREVFIGKGNNLNLVKKFLSDPTKYHYMADKDKFSNHFFLKIVQTSSEIDYYSFKQGKQIVNHIPNMIMLTSKIELLKTLKDFQKNLIENKEPYNLMNYSNFIPKTYRLNIMSDQIQFLNDQTHGIWIYKPRNQNQGKGIRLVADISRFKKQFLQSKKFYLGEFSLNNMLYYKPELDPTTNTSDQHRYADLKQDGLIQHYLEPYLLGGYKFDIRCYLYIHSQPQFVLFNRGYLRRTLQLYSQQDIQNTEKLFIHLTNNCFQRKHPEWKTRGKQSIAGWGSLQKQLTNSQLQILMNKIKKILIYVYASAQKKLQKKQGFYQLLGCDILITKDLEPYLLQINTNPALFLDTPIQNQVIPPIVDASINIAIQCFDKPHQYQNIIQNYKVFEPLYNAKKKQCFIQNSTKGYLISMKKINESVKKGQILAEMKIHGLSHNLVSQQDGTIIKELETGSQVCVQDLFNCVQ